MSPASPPALQADSLPLRHQGNYRSYNQQHRNRKDHGGGGGKSLQWCPTLCDLRDCSLPGSSVHGIL